MVDIVKLAESVQQMRTAQNEYFRTRSSIALATSKKLEREVDDMVKASIKTPLQPQGDMFGKALPVTDPNFKHEIKFCLDQEMDTNEHGQFVFVSSSGAQMISLPYILSDFRDWMREQGITKDYQRS